MKYHKYVKMNQNVREFIPIVVTISTQNTIVSRCCRRRCFIADVVSRSHFINIPSQQVETGHLLTCLVVSSSCLAAAALFQFGILFRRRGVLRYQIRISCANLLKTNRKGRKIQMTTPTNSTSPKFTAHRCVNFRRIPQPSGDMVGSFIPRRSGSDRK